MFFRRWGAECFFFRGCRRNCQRWQVAMSRVAEKFQGGNCRRFQIEMEGVPIVRKFSVIENGEVISQRVFDEFMEFCIVAQNSNCDRLMTSQFGVCQRFEKGLILPAPIRFLRPAVMGHKIGKLVFDGYFLVCWHAIQIADAFKQQSAGQNSNYNERNGFLHRSLPLSEHDCREEYDCRYCGIKYIGANGTVGQVECCI